MSTLALVHDDVQATSYTDEISSHEYLSITETAALLDKSRSRVYGMAAEGLLQAAGLVVVRTKKPDNKKGRIWIGITRFGLLKLSSMEQKGDP
jgi:hypothetical protein